MSPMRCPTFDNSIITFFFFLITMDRRIRHTAPLLIWAKAIDDHKIFTNYCSTNSNQPDNLAICDKYNWNLYVSFSEHIWQQKIEIHSNVICIDKHLHSYGTFTWQNSKSVLLYLDTYQRLEAKNALMGITHVEYLP